MQAVTETVKIDKTEEIKAGLAAYWDDSAKLAKIMPKGPTAAQIKAFIGIFNSDRKKIGADWAKTAVYEDHVAVVVAGPAYVIADAAVAVGSLLEFTGDGGTDVAGRLITRTHADADGLKTGETLDAAKVAAEITKQATLPRIRALQKATAAGDKIKVTIGGT
ncbi:MAG: hypothetical protein SCH70_07860 [Candidatus Methanoperedens sp.]|nr:hypothetical protein [Candidatus Methanoperedens sp.]